MNLFEHFQGCGKKDFLSRLFSTPKSAEFYKILFSYLLNRRHKQGKRLHEMKDTGWVIQDFDLQLNIKIKDLSKSKLQSK